MPIDTNTLLASVADEMLEGLQIISRDWRYLYVNETAARQGKTSKERLIGRTMTECYPGIEKTPLFAQLRKCLEDRADIRFDNEFSYPDGTSGWFRLYLHPVQEGLLILSVDITDQKQAERALKEKIDELDRISRIVTGREARMRELKDVIRQLKGMTPLVPEAVPLRRD